MLAGFAEPPAGDGGCELEVDGAEQQVAAGLPDKGVLAGAEQQLGTTGLGAPTPAISEPRPSFWSVGASSFPVESRPFADWNFWIEATVPESSLPVGSPW